MPVPNVEISNSCLSAAKADFVQPVVSNTVRTDPIPWPLNLFSVLTATVFLPLTKNSVTFFLRTVLFRIVCLMLSAALSFVCFIRLTIHCLITEGGFSDDGFWRAVKHFNYMPNLTFAIPRLLLNTSAVI